jgi:hypothetical protein
MAKMPRRALVAFSLLAVAADALRCSASRPSAPRLTTLELGVERGGTTWVVTLVPSFSPAVHDYYVLCGEGANAFTVSLVASSGAESLLQQPTPSAPQPRQTIDVTLSANQAIVAVAQDATSSTSTTEYWIRCLPPDFPATAMVQHPEAGIAPPGYYLIGDETPAYGGVAYAMVLDQNGVPVWYEALPQTTPFNTTTGAFDVDSLVSGDVSLIPWPSRLASAPFEIRQLSSGKTVSVEAKGQALDPHELRVLPNGDFLIFTDQIETGIDLTGYDVPRSDGGVEAFGPNASILPCKILEVDPGGNLVWQWTATDHLDPVKDSTYFGLAAGPDQVDLPDPFHCNSIDVDLTTGNLLVSARHMDSVFLVERSSGRILWKMGGATYTKDTAAYVPVPDAFHKQHDARLLPGWSSDCGGQGQLSLFDDESFESNPARAVVYDVRVGSLGTGDCGTPGATVAWQVRGQSDSSLMGSFRITGDGSRVIGWGIPSRGSLAFTEVDSAGADLLDFFFAVPTYSYRAIKVPLSALDIDVMRRTAGNP